MKIASLPSVQFKARKQDKDWQDAGKLMDMRGIPAQDHQFMQENVAAYLSHRDAKGALSERWQHKVDRELNKPFTDDAIGKRLDFLQSDLLANVQELPAYPSKIYLTGSFSRGRLGGNSDLDGYAEMKPEQISAGFDSYENRVDGEGCCLFPMSETRPGFNRANLMYAGASVAIDPQKLSVPGYLRQTYQFVLDHRNESRRETAGWYEGLTAKMWGEGMNAKEKRESFEGKTFKSRLTNSILAMGGTMAAVPLVGAVVRKVADLAVRQNHLTFEG